MRMKIKKKIVMLLPNLQTGGAEKVSLFILNNLSDDLFEKHLILFQKKGKNLNNVNKNINIINLNNPRLIFNSIKIINIILKYKFDIVFSSFYHINIFLGFIKFFLSFKLVIRESNDPIHIINRHSKKKLVLFLYKFFYPKADKIILPAKYLIKRLNNLSIPKSKIKVIYNPVYKKKIINKSLNRSNFCAIGRLTYQKGFDELIKTVNNSSLKKLYIIGSGAEKKNLLKLSNKSKIIFIKETNPKKFLLASKALFFSSRWEGMPNIALESLMYGTPIISISKIDSILELKKISKKNSILIVDKKNFEKSITRFINFKKLKNKNFLPKDFNIDFAINKYQKVLYWK